MNLLNFVIFVIYFIYHVGAVSLNAVDDGENIFNDAQNGFIPGTRELKMKQKSTVIVIRLISLI